MEVIINISDFDLKHNTHEIIKKLIKHTKKVKNKQGLITIYDYIGRHSYFFQSSIKDIKSITFNNNTVEITTDEVYVISHNHVSSFKIKLYK